jgi:glycosyltransferase involved in cell wall biosynthesis
MVPISTGADTNLSPKEFSGENFRKVHNLPDKPLLLYMGSMSPIRRLEFLFDVLERAIEKIDMHLVMVGGRNKQYRDRLRREAHKSHMGDHVTFTGWISDEEHLNNGIVAADIGLSPIPTDGILRTNAPLKVLEYLNLKTPVVATDTPDQRQVVEESGGGRIAPYDAEIFAGAVVKMLQLGDLDEMGKQGREYIENYRSYATLTRSVQDAYKDHLSL